MISNETRHEWIATRAYYLYLEHGSQAGGHLSDWLEAENEYCLLIASGRFTPHGMVSINFLPVNDEKANPYYPTGDSDKFFEHIKACIRTNVLPAVNNASEAEALDNLVNTSHFTAIAQYSTKHLIDEYPFDVKVMDYAFRESSQILSGGYSELMQVLGASLTAVCAAGGAKMFIEILKVWLEERKGRRVKIKKGDIELEIQGGVSKEQVEQIIMLLDVRLTPSKIIQP